MRSTYRLAAGLVVAALLVLPGVAGQATIDVDFPRPTPDSGINVHATNDAAKDLFIEVEDDGSLADAYDALSIRLVDSNGGLQLELALTKEIRGNGIFWTATLPVDHPELHLGTYSMRLFGFVVDDSTLLGSTTLRVTGVDDGDPVISLADADDNGVLSVHGLSIVVIDVVDRHLGRVFYKLPGMAQPAEIDVPYSMPASALGEGAQNLTVIASDRAGNVAIEVFTVIKDSSAPVFTVDAPAVYRAVPFDLTVAVADASASRVVLHFNNETYQKDVEVGGGNATFEDLVFGELGDELLSFTVRDKLGHTSRNTTLLSFGPVPADLRIQKLEITPGPLLGDDLVQFRFEVDQDVNDQPAIVHIETNVTMTASDGSRARLPVDAPGVGNERYTHTQRFTPGIHTVSFDVLVPEHVVEIDVTDQSVTGTFEVFAGRVDHHDDSWYIRVSPFGLPLVAVDLSDDSTYALEVPTPETDDVYRFEVDGMQLFWDPLMPITVVGDHDESDDSPGLGAVALIGLLAAAFAARRRD